MFTPQARVTRASKTGIVIKIILRDIFHLLYIFGYSIMYTLSTNKSCETSMPQEKSLCKVTTKFATNQPDPLAKQAKIGHNSGIEL
jgi:hypothetical protein